MPSFFVSWTLCSIIDVMNLDGTFRLIILLVSAGAMVIGVLVMAGILFPPNMPDQFRVILGIVIVLYGAYRFANTYFGKRSES